MPSWIALLCALQLIVGTTAFARKVNDLPTLFGGVMPHAAQSEPGTVPTSDAACLDQALRQQGANVEALMQRGVMPSDPRLCPPQSGSRSQFAQGRQQIDIDIKSAFEQCRGSKDPKIKASSCSFVIQNSKNRSQVERAYNSRGHANLWLKNYSNAAQDFSRAIELDKKNAGYVDNRTTAFFALGQLDLALEDANRAVKLAPKQAFVYRARGILFGELKSYDKAINDMTIAISLDHAWTNLLVDRGRLFAKVGRFDAAISDFDRALELSPNLTWANRERGLTYKLMGDRERARSDLTIDLSAQPDDVEIKDALRELQEPTNRGHPDASGPKPTQSGPAPRSGDTPEACRKFPMLCY
jgi:tetratricopeptide (TPR) repeat protein